MLFVEANGARIPAIGLGTSDTPTPGGVYYLKELLRPPDPHGFYGPYAFGTSAFSNTLCLTLSRNN